MGDRILEELDALLKNKDRMGLLQFIDKVGFDLDYLAELEAARHALKSAEATAFQADRTSDDKLFDRIKREDLLEKKLKVDRATKQAQKAIQKLNRNRGDR